MSHLKGDIMEIINMSRKKFKTLTPLILPKTVKNAECELFNYRYRGKKMLIKKFLCHDAIFFTNKLYTLEAIDVNRNYIPDYFIKSEYLLSIDKRIEAFAMPLFNGVNLSMILNDSNIDIEEKKFYLKRIGQILNEMKNIRKYTPLSDFYIGDLHEDNLIVDANSREVYVADFDSCKILGNKTFYPKYLTNSCLISNLNGKYKRNDDNPYLVNYEVDENTDLYCYTIMILNYLYGGTVNNMEIIEFYNYLNYLNDIKIDLHLLECFNKIVSNGNNENPVDYIETLTQEQIGRARKRVYMCNR